MIALLCIVSVASTFGMENKKKNNKKVSLVRKKSKDEFLIYPKDAVINIDGKNLPKGISILQIGNAFLVPEGFDEKLIHKTLVPKRISTSEEALLNKHFLL